MSDNDSFEYSNDIAIIGMAGRFPGAGDVDTFWKNLCDGIESVSFYTEEELAAAGVSQQRLADPNFIRAGAELAGIEDFDASFFGFVPREAEITDPQQRLFLECAWQALENAGYDPESYAGAIGVYAGSGMNTYLLNNLLANRAMAESLGLEQVIIANDKDFLATRVSYKLNLTGPSLSVQTACSTSLVAVHLAVQSLLNGECDMALAGGASVQVPQKGYQYHEGGILSPDGHCRVFDAQSQGTVFGNAVALVVLKRLSDAQADGDQIYAVIRGSAINNDGAVKGGFTAPSVAGQSKVVSEALAVAGVPAETIGYVEAHGTGTAMGDPIEIAALTKAFGSTSKRQFCAIGSLKANVGHLDRASGVTGLIKTALALKHELLPPLVHYTAPNPKIDFANSPFYVNAALSQWRSGAEPRRAGVSSLGIGGTNAHVVLEEAPELPPTSPSRPWQLLLLSARTPSALDAASRNLAAHLRAHPEADLADVAFTLQAGRRAFGQRRAVLCATREEAIAALEGGLPERTLGGSHDHAERPLAFLFPGQGAQYVQMGRGLYESEPVFRDALDACAELLLPALGRDLRELLFPADDAAAPAELLGQTQHTQPALFAVEYALAQLWMSWGLTPRVMIGHSIGEYVAACLAGVFSLEDALALVAARGRLMQRVAPGAMLSVPLAEVDLLPMLGEGLDLAAVNAPGLCVVSGPHAQVAALAERLAAQGVETRPLHTSHAFHSAMMEPVLEEFAQVVRGVRLSAPTLKLISNLTGQPLTAAEATDPAYWVRHLRQTVRFADGIAAVLSEPGVVLLELGPGRVLSTLAQQNRAGGAPVVAITSLRHPQDAAPDQSALLGALARLWLVGVAPAWSQFYAGELRRRVPLPTYPFERQRYWIEAPREAQPVLERGVGEQAAASAPQAAPRPQAAAPALHERPSLPTPYVAPRNEIEQAVAEIWQELLGIASIGVYDNFFELGGHSLLATQVVSRVRQSLAIEVSLGSVFNAQTIADFTVALAQAMADQVDGDDLAGLLSELEGGDDAELAALLADLSGGGDDDGGQIAALLDEIEAEPAVVLAAPVAEEAADHARFEVDTAGLSLPDLIQNNLTAANPHGEVIKDRTRQFYNSISEHLSTSVFGEFATFLNYGYVADGSPQYAPVELPINTVNRNSLKLILEVIGQCDLNGKDVLDISSGRGGTLAAVAHYFRPRRMVGGDLSTANIAFCQRQYAGKGITFQLEDADHLSFADDSFDVLINVEASHLYPSIYRFYNEVWRVLRPGGCFLYTDLLDARYQSTNLPMLRELGFEVEHDRDITANVLLSCDEAASRNMRAYTSAEGGSERLNAFLAAPGSGPYQELAERRLNYRILRLRKPA